jgi:hypothetical protein
MPFQKHTQSEDHEVVKDEERDTIRKTAGQQSVEQLEEAEKIRLLRELEAARQH